MNSSAAPFQPVPLFVAPSIMQQQQPFGFEPPFVHSPMMQQHLPHSQAQSAPMAAAPAPSSARKGGDARPRRPPQPSRPQSAHAAAVAAAADGISAPPVTAAAAAGGGRSAQQQQSGRTPPVRHTQQPPLPPPVAECLAIGYLGSCGASGGLEFASAGRSNAQLINALCGRTIFPTVASEEDAGAVPFAQEALRRARARASRAAAQPASATPRQREQRGAPASHTGRAPIRLAERHASDSESDTEPEAATHTNGAQLPATKAGEEQKEASPASMVAEDVAAPVSSFAALQLHVDTRNKLLHMQMAPVRPATSASASSPGPGLGLGLDAPLGFESEGWAAELARLPHSFFSRMDGAEFHAWLVSGTSQRLRAALFLFCTCHYVVVLHPSPQLQLQWVQLLRLLQALKSRLLTCFSSAAPAGASASGGAAAATTADAAALYRALFSSMHLSAPESKALAKCSSPLSLCFTPCVSFVVQRPRMLAALGGVAGTKEAEQLQQQFGDAFAAQLAALCAQFGLVAPAQPGQADVSPAASAVLQALKHTAPEKPENSKHPHSHGHGHSHSHSHGHAHGHGHGHGGSGTHPALFEPAQLFSTDEQQRAADGDDSQRLVAPLMYLHTQRSVIVTCFDELFDAATPGAAALRGDPALSAVSSSSSAAALSALRGALERCIFVARAQLDSLSPALPRDLAPASAPSGAGSAPAQGLFSLARLLHSMQTVHSWVTQRVSPCAIALDAALLQCLHVDFQYSSIRCEKAAAVAKKLYINAQQQQSQLQQSRSSPTSPPSGSGRASAANSSGTSALLPPGQFFYSALVHKQRLSTCVRLFHKLAGAGDGEDGAGQTAATAAAAAAAASADPSRSTAAPLARALGPAVSKYESLLRRDLEQYWLGGHRGCDAVSVLHHACVFPLGHDTPRGDGGASASGTYPLAHASQMAHSLRLSCHCGLSLLKLAKEPFDPSEIRAALTDRCCSMQVQAIGALVYPQPAGVMRAAVDGSNGWNVLRYERPYNPSQGLSSLRGFYPNAGRTCFLPRVRFSAGATVLDTYVGLVYECPLGHRWVCEDEESKATAAAAAAGGGGGSAPAAAPASRGFPRGRSDCFIFLPCVICRYLRHLQQKAASDAAAEQRQRRLHKEEKHGRLMLQAQRQHGSADADSLAQHTVPSSTVRSHDRYAQLRRILIVTPPAHVAQMQLDLHVKSTKPLLGAAAATAAPNASLASSSGGPSASGSASSSSDNLTPTGSSEAQHALLPPAAFVAVQLPFVYWRQEGGEVHCFTSPEAKHCVLLSHAVSLA